MKRSSLALIAMLGLLAGCGDSPSSYVAGKNPQPMNFHMDSKANGFYESYNYNKIDEAATNNELSKMISEALNAITATPKVIPILPDGIQSKPNPFINFYALQTKPFNTSIDKILAFPGQKINEFVAWNEAVPIVNDFVEEYGMKGIYLNSAKINAHTTGKRSGGDGVQGIVTLIGKKDIIFTPTAGTKRDIPYKIAYIDNISAGRILAFAILHETIWHKSGEVGEGSLDFSSERLNERKGVHIGVSDWNNIIPYEFLIPQAPGGPVDTMIIDDKRLFYLAQQLGYIVKE